MHPITASRLTHGQFYMIMSDLRADDDKFFDYFRMTQESFNELLAIIGPHIRKDSTHLRKSIPAEERLAMTLRYVNNTIIFSEFIKLYFNETVLQYKAIFPFLYR